MLTLIVGGARSGKSAAAESRAAAYGPPVTYVATGGQATGGAPDPDWERRVALHRARRPASWSTIELGPGDDLAAAVRGIGGTALVDSLGLWVAGRPGFDVDTEALCDALGSREAPTVVVSEEVGLGVHPATEAGRAFRDALGVVNQAVGAVAGEVLLVVAGRVLRVGVVG